MRDIGISVFLGLVGLGVGFIWGVVYGEKFAYKILEREGRLKPGVPPAVRSSDKG